MWEGFFVVVGLTSIVLVIIIGGNGYYGKLKGFWGTFFTPNNAMQNFDFRQKQKDKL